MPRFHLVKMKVYNKSDCAHKEEFLEESDNETSFGTATIKKGDHDTSKLNFCYLSFSFSGPGEIDYLDYLPQELSHRGTYSTGS